VDGGELSGFSIPVNECGSLDNKLFGNLLAFVYHCFDRIVIHGYLSALSRPRGFTYLKLGWFEQAIANYNAALARSPRDPGSLYGRGLERLRFGDPDGGRNDLAAAKAPDPDVTAEFARYGLGK
jgi:hypothetical protein